MGGESRSKLAFFQDLIMVAAAPMVAYLLFRNILSRLEDPEHGRKEETKRKALGKLDGILASKRDAEDDEYSEDGRRLRKEDLNLTQYEQMIAMEVIAPDEIPVSFQDIGGLDDIIEEVRESVIYPLTLPHLYAHSSSLLSAPSGVLLYGPPGCGKTMLAKALARESGATFINLHISTITEKWYGDSNKLVNAVFSLARKLQPSIVFIDEIDAVLGQRRSGEHEASGMVKAEFMTHWDGLTSASAAGVPQRICILGATNRIQDIDEAILRRMPKKFPVSLPSAHQRRRIFRLILRDTKVDRENFDLDFLVRMSAGMSGSDIKDICRDAAMCPMREYIKAKQARGELLRGVNASEVRGVRTGDFFGNPKRSQKKADSVETVDDEVESEEQASANASGASSSATASSTSEEFQEPMRE
ncbi:ATPase family AAA domain-containing protein 1 [Lineolata rhizophorae]|uniref:ATPase family AAA domain-containing protein 1 n=1 Tax=Lineolata rhizophorae TaxID=578093 RepID=A0A6A6NUB6_9PEZI|nr:ATPase family AAA domain-containing protein 1 [Lineolata rhizophorae]